MTELTSENLFQGTVTSYYRHLYKSEPSSFKFRIKLSDESELSFALTYYEHIRDVSRYRIRTIVLQDCPQNIFVKYFIINGVVPQTGTLTNTVLESKLANDYTSSDYVTVLLQIWDLENERLNSIVSDYNNFFQNGQKSDALFVIQDKDSSVEIPAHKQIISARCDVMAKMFDVDMLENKSGRVEITDIEPAIFKLLLRYIYCGQLESVEHEDLRKLIIAAHKYSLQSLIDTCEYRLSKKLSVDNIIEILITADLLNVDFLKRNCIKFLIRNKDFIAGTENFENMVKSHPKLVSEILLQS